MCVETHRTVLIFPRQLIWGVTCLGLFKKWTIPIYLLRNPRNMCWNHQNGACFSKMFDLRGHMPRFTWKMNIFPSISLDMPEMCVVTIKKGFVFPRQSIWVVTWLGLLRKWMFSHLSPQKPHKCVLKPSEQVSFFQDNDLRCHMPRLSWKMNIFPSICLELHKLVLELSEQGLFFQDDQFEGSHA